MALALSMTHWSSQPLLHHQVRNFRIFYYNDIVCNNFMTFTRPTLTSHSTQCFETLLMKLNVRYATFSTRRSTLVGQHPMKSLSSVCLSVRPSLNFLKIGSNAEARLTKKIFGAQIWAKRANIGPKISFFAIFSSLIHWKLHIVIVCNNV